MVVVVLVVVEEGKRGLAVAKATDNTMNIQSGRCQKKKTHVTRGWLSSKYQLPHLSPDEFTSAPGLCTCW